MEHRNHFFFAVKIPDETKLLLKERLEKLKESLPFNRWVHHQDLHITLAFLGGAASEKLAEAEKKVREAIKDENAFSLKINKLGIFGNQDSPRIFWADTIESRELNELRDKVFSACEKAGFQLETRPFRPHITLARKWNGEQAFQREQLEVWQGHQPELLTFQAQQVVLYQTHLQKTPKYEAKTIYPLK
ncbi:RNA 2',3'-cyclic phosphodiesterase [Paenibacillus sp. BSR1-1]|uniref:RNA 2',3'-cyclic phosphodiesterase n=1 Tax=Paenibacillus sp. BSR1-1 TaxID=3020845 RepID=UPI0025B1C334|nr:RNA 2',3'-cyclic phosphodiesterase [Paenibacillus sp. BSR1-1]MDN3018183.1 RNA 2',3'-cyclic phosphodiesterase [Paenibacillus sp. BSR1-1]